MVSRTLLALATVGSVVAVSCRFSSGVGATFDVSNLASSTNDYLLSDSGGNNATYSSQFMFNICQNTVNGKPKGNACGNPQITTSPAWQHDSQNCVYAIGGDVNYNTPQFSLYDPTYPNRGFQVIYPNGDNTHCGGISRNFTLNFRCANFAFPSPSYPNVVPANQLFVFVGETNQCDYQLTTWTTAGCPQECPIVNGQICGGNGVCGYDNTPGNSRARCFCYNDWLESDCQTPRYPFPSGAIAGAVIGGLIVGALCMFGVAWWRGRKAAASVPQVEGFYAS